MFPNELLARLLRALNNHDDNSMTIVDKMERYVHDGNAYVTEIELTILAGESAYAVATIGTKDISMKTRVVQSVSTAAVDVKIELYEGVTSSGTPTAIPVYNLNRNSANVSTFSHVSGQTITGGTKMPLSQRLYSENKAADSITENNEYVMKRSTKYGLKVTNNGTQTATILLRWYLYEHEE